MDWINPLYAYLGLGGLSIAGLLAVAWYVPFLRKYALMAIGGIVAVLAIYRKGAKDAKERAERQHQEAERKSVQRGNQARRDAERDVRTGGVRDRFDRDDL